MPLSDHAKILARLADDATSAGEDPSAWRNLLKRIERLTTSIRSDLSSRLSSHPRSRIKIGTRCNPKLGQVLREWAHSHGKTHSRVATEAVEAIVSHPPRADSPLLSPRRAILRSLVGSDSITAVVSPEAAGAFDEIRRSIEGIPTKTEFLSWIIWNHIGQPRDRDRK